MSTEIQMQKMDAIKARVINQLLGDEQLEVPNYIETLTPQDFQRMRDERNAIDIKNCLAATSKEYFENIRKARDNGGYMVKHITENQAEVPPPIK